MANIKDLSDYPKAVQEFAAYKSAIQGCSPKTVAEYLVDLRMFCRYIKATREGLSTELDALESVVIADLPLEIFRDIKTTEIYSYINYVKLDRENQSNTRSRKLSSIRSFYKFLTVNRKYFEENPAKNIESPKQKKALPKHLSLEECVALLSAVKNDESSKTRERDFCILTLFLNCGMRLSELVGISLQDIEQEMRSMRVIGKGSKERVIYLNDACREALCTYLPVRLQLRKSGMREEALFLSSRGSRISVKTVQWMVKKYLDMAGLSYKNYSTHKLRHTAATLMYQSGQVDTRILQEILGHEQLNTTQIYTHVSNEGMENAMTQNPLANLHIDGIQPVPSAKLEDAEGAEQKGKD
ncbi:MAG: tyrosine recombinase XerC [Clostridiales bacterium]|jgi:integrase/recombinase XerC|nr:tyrosine recombinase XerC [Clostridiales bacterium]